MSHQKKVVWVGEFPVNHMPLEVFVTIVKQAVQQAIHDFPDVGAFRLTLNPNELPSTVGNTHYSSICLMPITCCTLTSYLAQNDTAELLSHTFPFDFYWVST